jgi:hypothetical protein
VVDQQALVHAFPVLEEGTSRLHQVSMWCGTSPRKQAIPPGPTSYRPVLFCVLSFSSTIVSDGMADTEVERCHLLRTEHPR